MSSTIAMAALLIAAPTSLVSEPSTPGWPQFRGPDSLGIADESCHPPAKLDPAVNLAWKVAAVPGHSSPCVTGGQIVVTGFRANGESTGGRFFVQSFSRTTGSPLWTRSVAVDDVESVHEISSPAAPSVATDGTVFVAYFGSIGLLAYDPDGQELWRVPLPKAQVARGFGTGSSPVIVDGHVILKTDLGEDSYLGAFRLSDGSETWRHVLALNRGGWSTPIVWRDGDKPRVGITLPGEFRALDGATGNVVWKVDGVAQQVCATPVYRDGRIIITAAGVQGSADFVNVPPPFEEFAAEHDRNRDGIIQFDEIPQDFLMTDRQSDGAGDMRLRQIVRWANEGKAADLSSDDWEKLRGGIGNFKDSAMNRTSAMMVSATDDGLGDARVVWEVNRGIPEVPSPLHYRNRIYLIRNGGVLSCLDAATGKTLYMKRVEAGGGYYASPVAADDHVYLASERGVVTVVRAGDAFEPVSTTDLGEPIHATPALVDDRIIVRTRNHLMAFGD